MSKSSVRPFPARGLPTTAEDSPRGLGAFAAAVALAACTHTYPYANARLAFQAAPTAASPDRLAVVVADADCGRWHETSRFLDTYKYAYGRLLCANLEPAFAGVASEVVRRPARPETRDGAYLLTVRLGDLALDWGAMTFSDNKAAVWLDAKLFAPDGAALWSGRIQARGVGSAGFLKGAVLGSAFGGGDKAYQEAMADAVRRAVGNAIGDLRAAVAREIKRATPAAAAMREQRP